MKRLKIILLVAAIFGLGAGIQLYSADASDGKKVTPAPNGIIFQEDYKDWRLIAVSQRQDNKTIRAILGNDVAISAARAGNTNPWPNGTVFAKVVWKDERHSVWDSAIVPGDFVHVEFMLKDSLKYEKTGGWGFARWKGVALVPYGQDENFVMECFGCHTPVKDNDYVFTRPVDLP